jgi:phospholipase/lecithinase/hemolysin
MNSCPTSSHLRRLVGVLTLSLVSLPAAWAGNGFSQMVVFGDSLSDTGRMTELTGGVFPAPPTNYVYGRQSNGPVWVEYLAERLDLEDRLVNYAVVGALTKPIPDYSSGNVWSDTFSGLEGTDVTSQVFDYLQDVNGVADPSALYVLQGGANDFVRVPNPAVIIQNLIESLVALQTMGAKHLLVVNLPNLGETPRVILAERMGLLPPGTGAFLSAATAQFNQALAGALSAYTFPGVSLTMADMHTFGSALAADPAAFGFTNVQEPYLLFGAGSDPATWLFWDDLHPTTAGHEVFAEQVVVSLVRTYSPGKGKVGKGAVNSLKGLVKARGR